MQYQPIIISYYFILIYSTFPQKNFDDLGEIINNLKKQLHIICLKETKIKNSSLQNLSIPVYNFINVYSVTNVGGVGAYVSEACQNEIITFDFQFLVVSNFGSVLIVVIQTLFMLLVLFIVILPPTQLILLSFWKILFLSWKPSKYMILYSEI